MRLFEAILDANHRALAGDADAGLHPGDFAGELPVVALTCIDARLNALFPEVLALPKEQFIWLRNAGNIITSPLSSTMRSLALACAVKGGREIAIIGHSDCQVCKTSASKLIDSFRALGVERAGLPGNLTEFFGLFASERQNVIKAVEFARHSPLIGPKIPVHGLMVDVTTGKLDWVVNGYEAFAATSELKPEPQRARNESLDAMKSLSAFDLGEMKFPDAKIGEIASAPHEGVTPAKPAAPPAPPPIMKIPLPPPLRPGTPGPGYKRPGYR